MHSKVKWAVVVAMCCGGLLLLVWKFQGRFSPPSKRAPVSLAWKPVTCGTLVLNSPSDFQELPVDKGAMADVLEECQAWQFASPTLQVQVNRSVYAEGLTLSLEGSVEGSIEGFRKTPGIRGLTHSETAAQVSGKPAIRVSIAAARNRERICLEGLTILDGQTLYQVQALFRADDPQGAEYLRQLFGAARLASPK